MAGFAFLFAPAAFAHIGPTAAFAATIATCVRKLGILGDVCGIAAVVLTLVDRMATRMKSAIVALLAIALGAGFYESSVIVARMDVTPLMTPEYEALHHASSTTYSIVLLCVAGAFVSSALTRRGRP